MKVRFLIFLSLLASSCTYRKPIPNYPLSVPPHLQKANPELSEIFRPKNTPTKKGLDDAKPKISPNN